MVKLVVGAVGTCGRGGAKGGIECEPADLTLTILDPPGVEVCEDATLSSERTRRTTRASRAGASGHAGGRSSGTCIRGRGAAWARRAATERRHVGFCEDGVGFVRAVAGMDVQQTGVLCEVVDGCERDVKVVNGA